MTGEFSRSGIRLRYPGNWNLEDEPAEEGWSIYLQSPATAFLSLSFREEEDDPARLADAALDAMRESYPDLEAETVLEPIAGLPAIGHNIEFFSLDFTNSCWIRALTVDRGCILLLAQCTDEELPGNGVILRAIMASLVIEEDA